MKRLLAALGVGVMVLFGSIILITQMRSGIVTALDAGDTTTALVLWAGALFICLFTAGFVGGASLLAIHDAKEDSE